MSSLSASGVVERASAELSKRINGLALRGGGGGGGGATPAGRPEDTNANAKTTSVMERVTNVLCGTPDKPSRPMSVQKTLHPWLTSREK